MSLQETAINHSPTMRFTGEHAGEFEGASFKLDCLIGVGGLSRVWRVGEDGELALKILEIPKNKDPGLTESIKSAFVAEGQIGMKLDHPCVVRYLASGHIENGDPENIRQAHIMPFLEGETLKKFKNGHCLPLEQTVSIVGQIAQTVKEGMHDKDIVHRDITPDNIMLDGTRLYITDLGNAVNIGTITKNVVMASTHYAALEQLRSETIQTAKIDTVGLATTAHDMLFEKPIFSAPEYRISNLLDYFRAYDDSEPRITRQDFGLSAPLMLMKRVIKRGLIKDPDERPDIVGFAREMLHAYLEGCETEGMEPNLDASLLPTSLAADNSSSSCIWHASTEPMEVS